MFDEKTLKKDIESFEKVVLRLTKEKADGRVVNKYVRILSYMKYILEVQNKQEENE